MATPLKRLLHVNHHKESRTMKITLLNGNPQQGNAAFEGYLTRLADCLQANGHTLTPLTLRDLNIRYCTGCFGCWVKRPGLCIFDDDSDLVRRTVIHSDFVLCASPVIMSFYSALLKKTIDKLIPLIHPHIIMIQGEMHHKPRYSRYPDYGLLLQKSADTDDEDIRIISDIHARTALNLHKSKNLFTFTTEQKMEEVCHAINLI